MDNVLANVILVGTMIIHDTDQLIVNGEPFNESL